MQAYLGVIALPREAERLGEGSEGNGHFSEGLLIDRPDNGGVLMSDPLWSTKVVAVKTGEFIIRKRCFSQLGKIPK